MNLPKAIEINTHIAGIKALNNRPDEEQAVKLGIKALIHCQRLRSDKHCSPTKLLPGETQGD